MLHTLEVVNIASPMARAFGLNVDLTEAIAFGHDIGQPPYGHCGQEVLQNLLSDVGERFDHGAFGAEEVARHSRVLFNSDLEDRYRQLKEKSYYQYGHLPTGQYYVETISLETLDGIRKHTPSDHRYADLADTMEGQIVRIADNIAYITQEIEDALGIGLDVVEFGQRDNWECMRGQDGSQKIDRRKKRDIGDDPLKGLVSGDILDIFSGSTGRRLNVIIERVVCYNQLRMVQPRSRSGNIIAKMEVVHSDLLGEETPRLEYDPLLDFFLDFLWGEFIAKKIWTHKDVKQRAEIACDKITSLFDRLIHLSAAQRRSDKWFRTVLLREAPDNRPDERLIKVAASKYIASMTDRFLDRRLVHYGLVKPSWRNPDS